MSTQAIARNDAHFQRVQGYGRRILPVPRYRVFSCMAMRRTATVR
jgi:hypothetical protein